MKFVTYKQAKRLCDLGFGELCISHYHKGKLDGDTTTGFNLYEDFNGYNHKDLISAPYLEEVVEWLEKEHNIFMERTVSRSKIIDGKIKHPVISIDVVAPLLKRKRYQCIGGCAGYSSEDVLSEVIDMALTYLEKQTKKGGGEA